MLESQLSRPASIAQCGDSFGPEYVQSPPLLLQLDSIITTAQPLQLNGLQHDNKTSDQRGRILITDILNPTAQDQPINYPDEPSSKRRRSTSKQISGL